MGTTAVIVPAADSSASSETPATAEAMRLAEEAGRASALSVTASIDAGEAQRTAEAAAGAASAAMAGQIVTVDMMTALTAELAAIRAEWIAFRAEFDADDDEEETSTTPVEPAPVPAKTPAKPKDQAGVLGAIFR